MRGTRAFKRGERAKVIWDKGKVSNWRREREGKKKWGKGEGKSEDLWPGNCPNETQSSES